MDSGRLVMRNPVTASSRPALTRADQRRGRPPRSPSRPGAPSPRRPAKTSAAPQRRTRIPPARSSRPVTSASTWARPRASARPTPCSPRANAGTAAAPTSSPDSSRPTGGHSPRPCSTASRSSPARQSTTGEPAWKKWTWTRCCEDGPRSHWSMSWPTPTCRDPAWHDKRWQDVLDILGAGINVITTVNIQHLESLADEVEQMTGTPVRERVPDWVMRKANQIENTLPRQPASSAGKVHRCRPSDLGTARYCHARGARRCPRHDRTFPRCPRAAAPFRGNGL